MASASERFAQRLRELVEAGPSSPQGLAKRLDVSRSTVHNWINGTTLPRSDHQAKDLENVLLEQQRTMPDQTLDRLTGGRLQESELVDLWKAAATRGSREHPRRRGRRSTLVAVLAVAGVVLLLLVGFVIADRARPRPPTEATSPVPPPVTGPPADEVMHEVWLGGGDTHPHTLDGQQWAMTEFPVNQPFLRSVEVNVTGPPQVDLLVLRHLGPDKWQLVAKAQRSVDNERAKAIFTPAIDVTPDLHKTLYLQVFNVEDRPMSVYFTNHKVARGVTAYLWCPKQAADTCIHKGQDLNALVYGWSRPS